MRTPWIVLAILLAGCVPYTQHDADMEFQRAFASAYSARVEGPAIVPVAARTTIRVQSGQTWVPLAQGARLLRAIGIEPHPEMLGMLVSAVRDPMVAVVYARDRRDPALPEVALAGWREAPDLAGFRPR